MIVTVSRRGIAAAVAIGLIAAGAITSVSYAAGSAASVSACANKKGQLGLLSRKSKCGKGFKRVAIAKQGPRGATGASGARGVQGVQGPVGPQGPGAVKLLFSGRPGGASSLIAVGSFSYRATCSTDGSNITTALHIAPASGVRGELAGAYSLFDNGGAGQVRQVSRTIVTEESLSVTSGGSDSYVYMEPVHLSGSDGSFQTISLIARVNPASPFFGPICTASATVTPSG